MEPRKSKINVDNSSGRRKDNTLESVDRISALPDSILCGILSLLPTKNALATSALSKRWEFVWRTVHTLDFCLEQVEDEDENEKFVGFVNHVLLHHDAGVLNKFRLVWTPYCIESHATSWIKTAITRKVHEISLTLSHYCNGPFDMPISVFSCDSLQSLQLYGYGGICLSAATVFCLPRLESLLLNRVTFQSIEALEKIIRGCPVLNYLNITIDDDVDYDPFRFIISSTSLRRLELNLGVCSKHMNLEASSLEHLHIYNHAYVSMNVVQNNLSSLVEADFEIYVYCDDDYYYQADICIPMVDSISALDRAKILTLSEDVMRILSCGTIRLSTKFERLVRLETSIKCCHWSSLQDFIQSSNILEFLTIYKCLMDRYDENDHDHDHSNWTTPVEVPRCFSTSLKKVVLNGYYGYEDEREMIRYMLNHGSVLKVVQISCDRDVNCKKFELLKEICEFPRKSPACKVKFLGWT